MSLLCRALIYFGVVWCWYRFTCSLFFRFVALSAAVTVFSSIPQASLPNAQPGALVLFHFQIALYGVFVRFFRIRTVFPTGLPKVIWRNVGIDSCFFFFRDCLFLRVRFSWAQFSSDEQRRHVSFSFGSSFLQFFSLCIAGLMVTLCYYFHPCISLMVIACSIGFEMEFLLMSFVE